MGVYGVFNIILNTEYLTGYFQLWGYFKKLLLNT